MSVTNIWQVITAAIILAVIFMLVRPGSPAATAVKDVSDALQALVKTSTGFTVQESAGGHTGG